MNAQTIDMKLKIRRDNYSASNLSSFYEELNEIAIQRNKKFVYKTEEEIAKMQEAVEYLNSL